MDMTGLTMTGLTMRNCGDCGDERPFERPPCADGHGGDCPEWICTDCGSAITIGDVAVEVTLLEATAA